MKKLTYVLTALLAVSCIYPFNPDIPDNSGDALVVSGDLVIGEVSTITLGYLFNLDAQYSEMKAQYPKGKVSVVNERGNEYPESVSTGSRHEVDLTSAPSDTRYRLTVTVDNGRKAYQTPWLTVQKAPEITDFSYKAVGNEVRLMISLDGGETQNHFRWDYEENWEYCVDFVPDYMYVEAMGAAESENPSEIYRPRLETEDYMYCWDSSNSVEYGLAETVGQSSNKVVDKEFISIMNYSTKLSVLYSVLVKVRGISQECYGYLHNLNSVSDNTGSLFSPIPSGVRGNIRSVSDTTEIVYGYVEATQISRKRFYIDQSVAHLYKRNYDPDSYLFYPVPDEDGLYNFYSLYLMGNSPVRTDSEGKPSKTNMQWAPTRCTDCRSIGGTKNKPQWWPNDHK